MRALALLEEAEARDAVATPLRDRLKAVTLARLVCECMCTCVCVHVSVYACMQFCASMSGNITALRRCDTHTHTTGCSTVLDW